MSDASVTKLSSNSRYIVQVSMSRFTARGREFEFRLARLPTQTNTSLPSETVYWTNWHTYEDVRALHQAIRRSHPRELIRRLPSLPPAKMLKIDPRDEANISDRGALLEKYCNDVFAVIDVDSSPVLTSFVGGASV